MKNEAISELYRKSITVNDFRERLYDDINDLAPEDYGLSVHVPDERTNDLVDMFCGMLGEKPYDYDDTGLTEFAWWFMGTVYNDRIDELIEQAMGEWISLNINEAARRIMED